MNIVDKLENIIGKSYTISYNDLDKREIYYVDDNKYIPYYSHNLSHTLLCDIEDVLEDYENVLSDCSKLYFKPFKTNVIQNRGDLRSYDSIYNSFLGFNYYGRTVKAVSERYTLKKNGEEHEFFVSSTFIRDSDSNFLLLIVVNKGYNNIKEKYSLLVNTDLVHKEAYASFYRKLSKELIPRFFKESIPVIYCTNEYINNSVFKKNNKLLLNNIDTINDIDKFLEDCKSVVKKPLTENVSIFE